MGVSKFPLQFRDQAVGLVVQSGRPIAHVAEELGIGAETLRRWVRQAEVDHGEGRSDQLSSDEKRELARLRRRVAELELEKQILKQAAVFFARETGQ